MASINDWKPEVGMEVFIVPLWGTRDPSIDKITKIGKKYFYVGRWCMERYFIDTKDEDGSRSGVQSHCYRCEADYRRAVELRDKRREIERNVRKLTDEQIDMVYEWITSNNDKI